MYKAKLEHSHRYKKQTSGYQWGEKMVEGHIRGTELSYKYKVTNTTLQSYV